MIDPKSPVVEFLRRNGFIEKVPTFDGPTILYTKTCEVSINEKTYSIDYRLHGGLYTAYSDNLNIYWLIGFLTYNNLMSRDYKKPNEL